MTITVAILDDRQLFREGLRLLVDTQPDLRVVAESGEASEGYALVASGRPSVAIVAQELHGVGGVAATREILRRAPESRVLIAAGSGAADDAQRALAAGARGYVLKSQPSVDLFQAVRAVARGDVYLPELLAAAAAHGNGNGVARDPGAPLGGLSARERQVFELLVRGHTNASIGRLLGISAKTVDTHRTKVLRKIGVHSIVELVRFAARNQLPLD